MNAYTVVGPTKVQPRFFRSFEIAVDVGVNGCTSLGGSPNVAPGHMYAAMEPNSSIISNAREALLIVERILP